VLDELLAAERVADRRLQLLGEREDLVVRAAEPMPQKSVTVRAVLSSSASRASRRRRVGRRDGVEGTVREDVGRHVHASNVAGKHDDGDPPPRDCVLHAVCSTRGN